MFVISMLGFAFLWIRESNDSMSRSLHYGHSGMAPLFVVFAALLSPVIAWIRDWVSYDCDPGLQQEKVVDFDEKSLRISDPLGSKAESPWPIFDCFAEGRRVFVIGTPGNSFTTIAKSRMSEEQRQFLRAILVRIVSK
ncbi:MAG TPA: YcxB family protein [Acidobacteriaceae bacterium]|jgi:hypothetical protein|nr:YcxB family protein [Acidobacteriaceae bacterium]